MSDVVTIEKLEHTYQLTREIIEDLSEEAVLGLLEGSGKDIDEVLKQMIDISYDVLGGHSVNLMSLDYVNKLTESVEETLRVSNFAYYVSSVLPEYEMNWHHLEWSDIIQRYLWFLILAARDHGKSWFLNIFYCSWKLYRYKEPGPGVPKDRSLSEIGMMICNTQTLANEQLDLLKTVIARNPVLSERLLPTDKGGDGWAKTQIQCRNGAKLRARGLMSFLRGGHPGYIIGDDVLKDNNMYSAEIRAKTKEVWHGTVMNMIQPGGQVGMIGTPYHMDDLYMELKKDPDWHCREYPCVDPNGNVLWANRHSIDSLRQKRRSQGPIRFARELMVKPITNDAAILPFEILQRAIYRMEQYTLVRSRDNFPVKFKRVVVGVDLAISASAGADYGVMLTLGLDEVDTMWLLALHRFQGKSYAEQMALLRSINVNFRPDVIFVEANQYQMAFAQEADRTGMPVKPHTTTAKNKHDFMDGLPGLALLFERNRLRFPYAEGETRNSVDLLMSELSSIAYTDKGLQSVGQHDDTAMALWLATLAARHQGGRFFIDFV